MGSQDLISRIMEHSPAGIKHVYKVGFHIDDNSDGRVRIKYRIYSEDSRPIISREHIIPDNRGGYWEEIKIAEESVSEAKKCLELLGKDSIIRHHAFHDKI